MAFKKNNWHLLCRLHQEFEKVMRFDKNNDLVSENAAIVSQILSTTVVTTVVLMEICLENLYVDIGA